MGGYVRELMKLAALVLVGGFEFLVLHPQTLLFQHDLLVQTGERKGQIEIVRQSQQLTNK